jgi:hypothetical protein
VRDRLGQTVDVYRARSAAEHAAGLLSDGLATVHRHALIGCRAR